MPTLIVSGAAPLEADAVIQLPPSAVLVVSVQLSVPAPAFRMLTDWSVAFDPGEPGRIFASVHEDAIYVSDDDGRNWRKDGLEGSSVFRMKFVPEAAR